MAGSRDESKFLKKSRPILSRLICDRVDSLMIMMSSTVQILECDGLPSDEKS